MIHTLAYLVIEMHWFTSPFRRFVRIAFADFRQLTSQLTLGQTRRCECPNKESSCFKYTDIQMNFADLSEHRLRIFDCRQNTKETNLRLNPSSPSPQQLPTMSTLLLCMSSHSSDLGMKAKSNHCSALADTLSQRSCFSDETRPLISQKDIVQFSNCSSSNIVISKLWRVFRQLLQLQSMKNLF